jgi:hypothetical protein
MTKNRTSMTVAMDVLRVDAQEYSSLTLEFSPGDERSLRGFDPERVYLEDQPGGKFGMVDPEGHRYCGVEKSVPWIEAAESRGLFFLVMQSPLDEGQVLGRILVVKYPFGQILRDTEIFRTGYRDFSLALMDGSLIRKALRGLADQEISSPVTN